MTYDPYSYQIPKLLTYSRTTTWHEKAWTEKMIGEENVGIVSRTSLSDWLRTSRVDLVLIDPSRVVDLKSEPSLRKSSGIEKKAKDVVMGRGRGIRGVARLAIYHGPCM